MTETILDRQPTAEEKVAKVAELGRNDLLFLGKNILMYDWLTEEEHRPLANFLMRKDRKKFSVIEMPRDTLKTTMVSQVYPIFKLLQNPNLRFLLDSEIRDNSKKRLLTIKSKMNNWLFKACYGDWDGSKKGLAWNEESATIAARTNFSAKENTFETMGVDVVANTTHHDIIIPDDLHSLKNSQTKDQIEKVIDHIKILQPLLDANGEMIFVCTPWDDKDAIQWFLDLMGEDVSHFKMSCYKNPETKTLNFPNRLPMNVLAGHRKIMGAYLFSCNFLLDPVSRDNARFQEEDIQFIKRDEVPGNLRRFVICDPAGDESATTEAKRDSDNYAIGTVGVSSASSIYLLDLAWGKFSQTEAIEHFLRFVLMYRPHVSGIEKSGLGNMAFYVREDLRKKGLFAMVEDLAPHGRSKNSRISNLEPKVKLRKFFIVTDCPNRQDIVDEFIRYPKGKHDDILDMIAYTLDMIEKYGLAEESDDQRDKIELEEKLGRLDPQSKAYWEDHHRAKLKERNTGWVSEFSS